MKGALIALLIGITLLALLYFTVDIYGGKGRIDIHLHGTYFVFNYFSLLKFIFIVLGTFFSIGGMVGTYFKSKLFLVLAVLFISIDIYYIASFY